MSQADKRSVATDALATLGTIIDETAGRDAIHIAVEPVRAGMKLFPGQHVGVADGVAFTTGKRVHVGIVDPFLTDPIAPDQWFWLFVYPRQITSLRHVWSHPAFPEDGAPAPVTDKQAASEQWLRDWLQSHGDNPGYDIVMATIRDGSWSEKPGAGYNDRDDYSPTGRMDDEWLHFDGMDAHGSIPNEFWDHVENVLGRKVPQRPSYFSCSC